MAFGRSAKPFFYAGDNPQVQAVSSAQARVDRIAAEARRAAQPLRRELPPPPPPLAPSTIPLDNRVAEELAYARRLLDSMGGTLACDMAVLARHKRTLQGFDVIGQILDGLAGVVGARDKTEAVDRLGLEDLRNRLRRTGLDGVVPRTGAEFEWGADWISGLDGRPC